MTGVKTLTGSSAFVWAEESEGPFTFTPSDEARLIITSCAPVATERAFWRKVVPHDEAA